MDPINTKLTSLLNIKTPIVSAPMYGATTPDLAAKVTAAGGFGFVSAGFDSSKQVKQHIETVRSALKIPSGSPVPFGVGFLGWILDMTETSDDPRLPSYLAEFPTSIWFSFGMNLGKYVAQVRAYDAKREHKTIIFVVVNTLAEALRAANEWKVDVLVLQGYEAGGRGSSNSPPLFDFLPAVLNEIPDGPPVLAAGGISTGSQIASLLTMGAAGVVLGTRFLFTHECLYTDQMKAVLVAAGENSTARSDAYDDVAPAPPTTTTWPAGLDGRAIINGLLKDYRKGLSLKERRNNFAAAKEKGDTEHLLIFAGVGVSLVHEIKSTTDVMHELHSQAVATLKSTSLLLG